MKDNYVLQLARNAINTLNRKKWILLLAVIVLFVSCVFFSGRNAGISKASSAEIASAAIIDAATTDKTKISENGLNISVDYGFDKSTKINNYMQMTVDIKSDRDFAGYAYAGLPDDDGGTIYSQKFEVKQGQSQKLTMYIPVNISSDSILFEIVDDDDDVVVKRYFKLQVYDSTTSIIGIISDNPKAVDYLTNENSDVIVYLNLKDLPQDYKALDSLDIIVIDNYDTKKLSDAAYGAIKAYVEAGGTLLLGTGENAAKVLGKLNPDYLKVSIGTATQQEIAFAAQGATAEKIKKTTVPLTIDGGVALSSGDSSVLFQNVARGEGRVLVAAFALAIDDKNMSIQKQISKLVYGYIISADSNINNDYLSSILQSVKSRVPSINKCVFVLVAYSVLMTIAYVVLTLIRKKELLWIVFPACSFVMCIVIFIVGYSSRMSRAHSTFFSMTTVSENKKATENIYFNITSPNNNKYTLKLGDKYDIYSVSLEEEDASVESGAKESAFNTFISSDENETQIMFKGMEPFTTRVYNSNREYVTDLKYTSKISCTNTGYTGEFTNETGYDISNACLLSNYSVIYIGDIANGATVKLDGLDSAVFHSKDKIYNALYKLLGDDKDNLTNSVDANGKITSIGLARALQYYALSNNFMKNTGACVFGVINNENNFSRNLHIDSEGIDTIALETSITYTSGKTTYVPDIKEDLSFISGDNYYNTLTHGVYIAGNTEAEYKLDKGEKITKLIYDSSKNVEYINDTGDEQALVCNVYLWNFKTKKYDKAINSGVNTVIEKFDNYISGYNSIKFKFETPAEEQISVPVIGIVRTK